MVPECIMGNWDTSSYIVHYIDKEDDSVYELMEDEAFPLEVIDDYVPGSGAGFTGYGYELEPEVRKFADPETEDDEIPGYEMENLVLHQFFVNPYSQGYLPSLLLLENIRFNGDKPEKELKAAIEKGLNRKLKDSDMDRLCNEADFAKPYITDLHCERIRAPKGSSFFLGPAPLVLFNMLDSECILDAFLPFGWDGTSLFMPVSPGYAVLFYDSSVYDLKSNVLTRNDVEMYNALQITNSSGVVLRNVEKEAPRYRKAKDRSGKDRTTYSDFRPSVLSVKKGIRAEDCSYRDYVEALMDYDRKYLKETENIFDAFSMSKRYSDSLQILLEVIEKRQNPEKKAEADADEDGNVGEETEGDEE